MNQRKQKRKKERNKDRKKERTKLILKDRKTQTNSAFFLSFVFSVGIFFFKFMKNRIRNFSLLSAQNTNSVR